MLNEKIVKLAEEIYVGTTYMPTREEAYQMAKLIIDMNHEREVPYDSSAEVG